MTFSFAPYAVDGARTSAALARSAVYTTGGGRSGITKPSDLQVLPLAVPGNGLRVTSGTATILNGYLADPDEVYVVSNPGIHTVLSESMPAPVPQVAHYMVVVVVGDPEFNQTGHPFMPSTPLDPAVAADFEYVHVLTVPCPPSATRFEQLGLDYPGYALARLEIPANTSTVTAAMITDLREMAQPRSDREVLAQTIATVASLQGVGNAWYTDFTDFQPTIEVPPWATRATIIVTLAGILAWSGSTNGFTRVNLGGVAGPEVPYDEDSPAGAGYSGGSKSTLVASAVMDVTSIAGTFQTLKVQANRHPGEAGYISTWGGSQVIFDVQFDEKPI